VVEVKGASSINQKGFKPLYLSLLFTSQPT
jgi:hypothetical protein